MGTLGRKAVWGAVVALSVLVPAASASASGNLLNVDKLLQGVSSGSPRQVIVRTRPDARDRVKKRLPNRGPGPVEHKLISAFTAAMDAHEIAALASDPDILSVSPAVFGGDNIVWGTMLDGADNIVWGTLSNDNIVWGISANRVTVPGTSIGGGL